MGLKITDKKYFVQNHATANSFLLANPAQKITERIECTFDFDFKSSTNVQVMINSLNSIKILSGSWSGLGFVVGDTVTVSYTYTDESGVERTFSASRTITDINEDVMTFNAFITINPDLIGLLFPTPERTTQLELTNSRFSPEQINFIHNLVTNDSNQNNNSLIDGEVNRFELEGVDGMAVTDVEDFIQLGNKSGGTYESVTLERLSDSGDKARYRIELSYFLPDIEDSNFDKPDWFLQNQCLKPTGYILGYPETNNPNSELSAKYDFTKGNTGWYNEEHNQGVNDFVLESLTIVGASGTTLQQLDPNQVNTITAVISSNANFQNKPEVKFSIIPPTADYKNNEFSHGQNTYTANFYKDGANPTVRTSFIKNSGQVTTANESVDVATVNQITIEFDIIPNAQFTAYINSLNESEQLYRISASVEKDGGTENNNNNVSLILIDGTFQKEPLPEVEFDGVISKKFYNHSQDLNTGTGVDILYGCTEDDFVYKAIINLQKDTNYLAILGDIEVVRNSDGAAFSLLNKTVPLGDFLVSNDGVQNIDYQEDLNQYLDGVSRNIFAIQNNGNTTATTYEVQILWSLLASWRYWLTNNEAFSDFIDTSLPNDGLNDEWMRYLREAGYKIRLIIRLQVAEQNFFFDNEIILQDYEVNLASPQINTEITYYDQDGNLQTSLLDNQEMVVRAEHTNLVGDWIADNIWGWISQRPFENEPNKRISTVWDWSSQNLPLKPKSGETKADITFPASNVARVEALVDTSLIDVENTSFIARIQSPSVDGAGYFDPFIMEVDTTITGETSTTQFKLPLTGAGYDAIVEWGDGSNESITTDTDIIHNYASGGKYIIKIYGDFPRIYFNNGGDKNKLIDIINWGQPVWSSMKDAFFGCANLKANITAEDIPDLSECTSMFRMFRGCTLFNSNINDWDVSTIKDMTEVFNGASAFNQPLNNWNVSNVTIMDKLFNQATAFNQPLNNWNVSNVTSLASTFRISAFNQPLDNWDVSNVTSLLRTFENTPFNQNINNWNVSNVTNMRATFANASDYNQPLNNWNVSNVTTIQSMFASTAFNQPLNNWNVSNVQNMSFAFATPVFNQDITMWVTTSLNTMANMFLGNTVFNQNISVWNVSLVTSFNGTFNGASSFNQNLASWNITNLSDATRVFTNSGMTTENYTDTIVGWANFVNANAGSPSGVGMTSQSGMTYTNSRDGSPAFVDAEEARNYLTTSPVNWDIAGDTTTP